MIRHDASYPETLRAEDWRAQAGCRGHKKPDLWFASSKGQTEAADAVKAKQICSRCPVRAECLARALDENEQFGIFGGLDEDERRVLHRKTHKPATVAVRDPARPRPNTLRDLFDERTRRLPGGHIEWTACTSITFKGDNYTPRQVAFVLDRGYKPTGTIKTTCDHKGCIQPLHITDADERGQCGTETAIRRHVARGEPVDLKCARVGTAKALTG